MRLILVPGLISTMALSRVGHGAYLPGSAIGVVPKAAPLVAVGTGALHADSAHLERLAVVVLCVVVPWTLMRDAILRWCTRAPAAEWPMLSP